LSPPKYLQIFSVRNNIRLSFPYLLARFIR